jgi:hypothetical protein
MQRGLIDDRARDGGGPIGQRSDGQSIEPVGPVRVQVALDGNLVELLWHARFLLHALIGADISPHCQRCLSHFIVVVGSVPGQEGGSEPSKGGNGGGSFSGQVTRGWMQVGMGGGYSESRWSALARATAWVRLSTWSLL